eukprot:4325381-Alexandrium_andersonii.AAC.1
MQEQSRGQRCRESRCADWCSEAAAFARPGQAAGCIALRRGAGKPGALLTMSSVDTYGQYEPEITCAAPGPWDHQNGRTATGRPDASAWCSRASAAPPAAATTVAKTGRPTQHQPRIS